MSIVEKVDWREILAPTKKGAEVKTRKVFLKQSTGDKIVLEFDVLKQIEHGYDVTSIVLGLRGSSTGYKAVFKGSELVAIVGEFYEVLPNEYVEEVFRQYAERYGFDFNDLYSDIAKTWFVLRKGDTAIIVRNAIDGSSALRIIIAIGDGNWYGLVKMVSARHYGKNATETLIGLERFFKEDFDRYVADVKRMMKVMETTPITVEDAQFVKDVLPQKYWEGYVSIVARNKTLKALWEWIAMRIWTSDTASMDTKYNLFKKLNEVVKEIAALKEVELALL